MNNNLKLTIFFVIGALVSYGQTIKSDSSIVVKTNINQSFDSIMLKNDIFESKATEILPISVFNFPRNSYMGSAGAREFELAEEGFLGVSYSIGNENLFTNLFSKDTSSKYQSFFTLLCYSAVLDTFEHAKVSSRNFPEYYLAQGYVPNPNCKIDYFAFIDYKGNSYAVINEKIFNLTENGNIIILIPTKSEGLQYVQAKTPYIKYTETKKYCKNLLRNNEIKYLLESAVKK